MDSLPCSPLAAWFRQLYPALMNQRQTRKASPPWKRKDRSWRQGACEASTGRRKEVKSRPRRGHSVPSEASHLHLQKIPLSECNTGGWELFLAQRPFLPVVSMNSQEQRNKINLLKREWAQSLHEQPTTLLWFLKLVSVEPHFFLTGNRAKNWFLSCLKGSPWGSNDPINITALIINVKIL